MEELEHNFRLVINDNPSKVKSLKDLSRFTILKCTCSSIKHMRRVEKLPLPGIVKDYVTTFRIPDDFDLNNTFMDYNFNFPYHLHHKTHQVHPAICQVNGSKVLIKVFHDWKKTHGACAMCGTEGVNNNDNLSSVNDFVIWKSLEHINLMNCLVSFIDASSDILGYVLEFPLMNIQNFVYKLFLTGQQLPEHLAWETFVKLTSVFLYLETKGVVAWDMCLPDHIVIDQNGDIKLENMLLYLPNKHRGIRYPPSLRPHFVPPELQFEGKADPQTVVWGIGAVVKELIAPIPSVLFHGNLKYSIPVKSKRPKLYSNGLKNLIINCMLLDPRQRPSLSKLYFSAKKNHSLRGQYHGPDNFLQCISEEYSLKGW